jgi:uncharacterized protein YprB with RNaseH-like and TPR domain
MSALAEKLARLGRQAGHATAVTVAKALATDVAPTKSVAALAVPAKGACEATASLSPPRPTVPEEIRRLLGIRTRALAPSLPKRAVDRELPGAELAPGLRFRESHVDWLHPPARLDASFAKGFEHVAAGDVLAFDTETTGLAGGTGTRAFMIGAADWVAAETCTSFGVTPAQAGTRAHEASSARVPASAGMTGPEFRPPARLRIRQLFLTEMRGETPMLEAFASWLAPSTVLVSYNGRCYDAPLLDTRFRLARRRSPLPDLRHLDLLFPTRRRYRGRWENCRLATIERHLLGVVREDDLPGSEAPRAWLDYLRGGDARDLRRVLAHNDQDLRSLVRLLLRLGEAEEPGL